MKLIVRDLCHKLDISHSKQVTAMLLFIEGTLIGPCVPLLDYYSTNKVICKLSKLPNIWLKFREIS